jgi:hypothetical protein
LIFYATRRLSRLAGNLFSISETSLKTSQLSTQSEFDQSMSISAPTTFYKGLRAPFVAQCYLLSQVGVRFSSVTVRKLLHHCYQEHVITSPLPNTLLSATKIFRGGPVLCQCMPLPLIMERGNCSLISVRWTVISSAESLSPVSPLR